MSITITDPKLATALAAAAGAVQLTLPDGTVLGVFDADRLGVPPPGVTSPVSADDMAGRRKQRTGRKLDDILRDLEAGMTYDIVWNPAAENELAAVWMAAEDRDAVTAAVRWFDHYLARRPLTVGVPQLSSVHRMAYFETLAVEYEVIEDDKKVFVLSFFAVNE